MFGPRESEYLARAIKVVPPVETLDLLLPEGRRASYPADPARFAEVTKNLGLASAGERLVQALRLLS